jgi:DnaJ-class molecular chaperone
MTRKEWAAIKAAADLLELGEKATLSEIKKAYRKLSKKHHPDVRKNTKKKVEKVDMHKLTEAYSFPLVPGDDEKPDGEDWWFERFGKDHHWG